MALQDITASVTQLGSVTPPAPASASQSMLRVATDPDNSCTREDPLTSAKHRLNGTCTAPDLISSDVGSASAVIEKKSRPRPPSTPESATATLPSDSSPSDVFTASSSSKRKIKSSTTPIADNALPASSAKKVKLDAYGLLCAATRRSIRQQAKAARASNAPLDQSPADARGRKRSFPSEEFEPFRTVSRGFTSSTMREENRRAQHVVDLCSPSPTKRPPTVSSWHLLTPPASSPIAQSTSVSPIHLSQQLPCSTPSPLNESDITAPASSSASPSCRPWTRASQAALTMSAPVTPGDDIDVMRGGSDCEDDDEHVEEDEPTEALLQARKRTMLRFGMAGAGGRARRNMPPYAATLPSSEVASQPAHFSGFDFTEMRRGLLAGNRGTQSSRMRLNTATSYLSSFTSHLLHSAYHIRPNPNHPSAEVKTWTPTYACAYSHSAKTGYGANMLALATESGAVQIVDTDITADAANERGYYTPHVNAIFDVKWSSDDSKILTVSGDQSSAVYDVASLAKRATLQGHRGSIKTGAWHDPNVIATGGRDGDILIYDLRTVGSKASVLKQYASEIGNGRISRAKPDALADDAIYPVLSIRSAHGDVGRRPSFSMRSATKSVTCLLQLKSNSHLLASGGSADGIIKLWDLRSGLGFRNKWTMSESAVEFPGRSAEKPKRSRGISSMVEGGGNIYSLGADSRVYARSISSPDLLLPISYSHPSLRVSSFYVKLAISPCERFLACGSNQGGVYAWEIGQTTRSNVQIDNNGDPTLKNEVQAVEMAWNGHRREAGAVDWGHDQLVSCSDDYATRIWRPNQAAANLIRTRPEEAQWTWAGVGSAKFDAY